MTCEEIKISMHDYVDELLNPDLKKEVEAHLRSCNTCFAHYKKFRKFFDELQQIPDVVEPPENLMEAIQNYFRDQIQVEEKVVPVKPKAKLRKVKREKIKEEEKLITAKRITRKNRVTRTLRTTRITPLHSNWLSKIKTVLLTFLPLIVIAVSYYVYEFTKYNSPWKVRTIIGTTFINGKIDDSGNWEEGMSLYTEQNARVVVNIPKTGRMEVDGNTLLILKRAKDGDNKVVIKRGSVKVQNTVQMPEFTFELAHASVKDIGGVFELTVKENEDAVLLVELGIVEVYFGNNKYYVDEGYQCEIRVGMRPGTPYRRDASLALISEIEKLDYQYGGDSSIDVILKEARDSDLLTLLAIIPRASRSYRKILFDRISSYYPPPQGVTAAGIMQANPAMLELWFNEIEWQI
jgi:hypothetical protein